MGAHEAICSEVLKAITPGPEEREHVVSLAEALMDRLRALLEDEGIEGDVRLEGSLAKDTWLSGEADVDIFVRFKPEVPREFFRKDFLRIARKAAEGLRQVERYAEHPYLECWSDGVRINIVPCYDVRPGEWLSATDRTPYHTEFVKSRLTEELKGDVRLLKKFMKGIGAYGAELRTGGFSGYLCELLVIYYGGFLKALKGALRWRRGTLIDIAGHYEGREDEAREFFRHHLIVVDPVDPYRNVAAPVRLDKMCLFMAAAREFMLRPSRTFFFPPEPRPLGPRELVELLSSRGTSIIAIHTRTGGMVPDVLWGQVYRTLRALRGTLAREGFEVLRTSAWSDERENCVLLLEFASTILPPVVRKVGPPVWVEEHVERFLSKNMADPGLVCGPYVEGDRWVVLIRRRWPDAKEFLVKKLSERGGRDIGVASLLARQIEEGFEVLRDGEIAKLCSGLEGFSSFLRDFLVGRPAWLAGRSA